MSELEVTKSEMRKCLDIKKIIINLIIYFSIYAIIFTGLYLLMYYCILDVTWWAVVVTIISVFFLIFEISNFIRLFYMRNAYKNLPCYKVKLDKVNYYLNKKIPVFACAIPTKLGTEVVETNAIYKIKDVPYYKGHQAKVLYDSKKHRIYVISLVD